MDIKPPPPTTPVVPDSGPAEKPEKPAADQSKKRELNTQTDSQKTTKSRLVPIGVALILLAFISAGWWYMVSRGRLKSINSYSSCVAAGYPVQETYPEKCSANGKTYTNPSVHTPTSQ